MKKGFYEMKKFKVWMDEKECFICLRGGGLMKHTKYGWAHGFCAVMHGNFADLHKM